MKHTIGVVVLMLVFSFAGGNVYSETNYSPIPMRTAFFLGNGLGLMAVGYNDTLTTTVLMDKDMTIEPVYEYVPPVMYRLTVESAVKTEVKLEAGNTTTFIAPPGYKSYTEGTQVTLSALDEVTSGTSRYKLVGWKQR